VKDFDKDSGEGSKIKTIKSSIVVKTSKRSTRYFIIKTFTHKHLEISIQKAIWSTQAHNEQKLNEAFEDSDVILIFSVNNSRHFQGYAKMTSKIGKESTNVWSFDGGAPWGGVFKVEWMALYDLPFSDTLHIRNPLNNHKPVKISRDGQELSPEVGLQLCGLLDEGAAAQRGKRKSTGDDEHQQKKLKSNPIDVQLKEKEREKEKEKEKDREKEKEREISPGSVSLGHSRERTTSRRASSLSYYHSSSRSSHSEHSSRSSHDEHSSRSHDYESSRYSSSRTRSYSRHSPRRSSGPLDLLNMTYEDYLGALGQLNSAFGMPEMDYYTYMGWYSKQQSLRGSPSISSRSKR